jgi:regulator of extracellular matrix RemA (YlzA/DUF370 family)
MIDRTELIHVGFDNSLALNRVIAVATPTSAPMKRAVHRAKIASSTSPAAAEPKPSSFSKTRGSA